ncbi:MAG: hypothetical protein L0312_28160 [Acidobacteria bacterium]|nr:hypothetical protein [Acidobacteriota bacterium]
MKLALIVAGGLSVVLVFLLQGLYMLRTGERDFFLGAWLSHAAEVPKGHIAPLPRRVAGLIFLGVGALAAYWLMPAMVLVAEPTSDWISANWVWLLVIVSSLGIGLSMLSRPEKFIARFASSLRLSADPPVVASIRLVGIAFLAASAFFLVAWVRH